MEGGNKDKQGGRKLSILVGPWGGNGGSGWDDGTYNGVREIKLVYDRCIDSIHVVYDKKGKPTTATERHGGIRGSKTAEIKLQYPDEYLINIKLQYPDEYLISVSGHYCPVVYGGTAVIRSLTFKTNKQTIGPFGVEEGTPFTFSSDGGRIVGFSGRSDWYLDSIGFHLTRAQTPKLVQRFQKRLQTLTSIASKSRASKDGERAYSRT